MYMTVNRTSPSEADALFARAGCKGDILLAVRIDGHLIRKFELVEEGGNLSRMVCPSRIAEPSCQGSRRDGETIRLR